jgi:hypothetical protein
MQDRSFMKKVKKKPVVSEGLFSRLFGKEGGSKKRILRVLKRELNAQKIDLYKIKHDTISPPVAKLIYEIYRLSYPLKRYLPLDETKKRLLPSFNDKFIVAFHPDEALALQEKLSQDYIKKLIADYGIKKSAALVEKFLEDYLERFNREKIAQINSIYTNFLGFARFVHFDFYPFLREFDTGLEEANFIKKPSFSSAEGILLKDDLIKMHRALFRFDADEKLDFGMDIVNKIYGTETISKAGFSKLRGLIQRFQAHNYLDLIIRAIDKSGSPVPVERRQHTDIFQRYSQKRKAEAAKIMSALKGKFREEAVQSVEDRLFEGSVTDRIKNYCKGNNESFRNLKLPLYRWVKPLNYLKIFLDDKYSRSIDRVINELIVGGIFINKSTLNDLSNGYYALRDSVDAINEFDDDLDIEGDRGGTIKRLLDSIEKEKGSRGILGKVIYETNERAKLIIDERIVDLREMAYSLRNILEDYKKKTPSIITNIKKIRAGSNREFIEELLQAYKDIYLLLKLLTNYVSIKVSKDEVREKKSLLIKKN